ncbi:O-antigen ligase family protein [Fibrobacter sp.]|uniref:O-antigen ligase family protein n=1 Tax=Fibrobacter sp. TaxID=35828 RepID=UPI00388EA8D2
MIKKIVLLVLLPVLVTVAYLFGSDDNFLGVYALSLMIGGLFMTFVTQKPLWGVLSIAISMHWVEMSGMSASFFMFAPFAALLFFYVTSRDHVRIDRRWLLMGVWTLCYTALVYAVKPYPINNEFFYMNLVSFFVFMVSACIRWDSKSVHTFLSAYLVFAVGWSVVERLVSSELRIVGPTMSSTNFAVLLVVAWTMWFINGFLVQKTRMLHLVLMTFLVFVSILFSGTRMGLLGLMGGLMLAVLSKYVVLLRDQMVRLMVRVAIAFVGVAILVVVVWNMLPDDLFLKQGLSTLLRGDMDPSSLGRIGAWLTAIDCIQNNPVWGIGPGNFLEKNKEFLEMASFLPKVEQLPRLGHAHNLFLKTWSEQGFVGIVGLGFVVINCVGCMVGYLRKHCDGFVLAMFSGLIVTLCLGMIDVFPLFPSSLGWGAWLMSVMFSMRDNKEARA